MQYFIVKQLACPEPSLYGKPSSWRKSTTVGSWLIPYFVELYFTSSHLYPLADRFGYSGAPFRWDSERRALLRADLDAGFLHIYGLDRNEAEHVLDSFFVVRKYDEKDYGEYRTKRPVLEAYDRMAEAIANGGKGWKPLADPLAGHGPRHSE
jgi:hypothetical protein